MGSAVTKPLTKRRGKVKMDEFVENSAHWLPEDNVNKNCQPSVDCLDDSLYHNVQPFNDTPDGQSPDSTSEGLTSSSLIRELTDKTPPANSFDKPSGTPSLRTSATPARAKRTFSFFDSCFMSAICAATYQERLLSPSPLVLPEKGVCCREDEQSREIFDTQTERSSTSQSNRSLRRDSISPDIVKTTDQTRSDGIISAAAQASHRNVLAPDQIGNIRNQLYTEGVNKAEREGGVAFFIPVTEDGMQPQTDWTVVAERLTKKMKSRLSFEERMILANINRQVQLSKRKEFAVRDIQNVKGAVLATDDDNVDATTTKKTYTDTELEAYLTKAILHAEMDAYDLEKRNFDAEYRVFSTGKEC